MAEPKAGEGLIVSSGNPLKSKPNGKIQTVSANVRKLTGS